VSKVVTVERRAFAFALVLALATTVGCTPTKLLKATADYSAMTVAVTTELKDAPGLVTLLCRDTLELEYLTERLTPGQQTEVLQKWFDQPFPSANGHVQISWHQRCDGLARADAAFDRGLAAIQQYGAALGEFAGHGVAPEADIQKLADAAADDAGKLSDDAKPYHDAIAGVGTGLAALAKEVEGDWQGRKLGELVPKTDPALRATVGALQSFIGVVRQRHLEGARVALKDLVHSLDQRRGENDVAVILLAGRLDIEITDHLDQIDARLKAMSNALDSLADAHLKLAEGWQHGEGHGLATLKTIAALAGDAFHELKAFQNAAPPEAL
jgi:hypothetical protein